MATPLLIQSTATEVVVFLELSAGGAATGLTSADVTAGIKKEGGSSFVAFTLSGSNFSDLGNGYYMVDLTAANTDTLGSLYMSFVGADIKSALLVARVAEEATAPPSPSPPFTPTLTTIFGYIYDSGGNPEESVSVIARVINQPQIVHPTTDGILLTSDFITTTTDESGFFTMNLIAGSTVEFIISQGNYRRTVLIPGSTANLFDIP